MRVAEGEAVGDDRGMLLTCQTGYENLLAQELEGLGAAVAERGPGWVRAARDARATSNVEHSTSNVQGAANSGVSAPGYNDLVFAHLVLLEPVEVVGESVNALAGRVGEFFLESLRGERVEAAWPCVWAGPHEVVGLGRRVAGVEAAFGEILKKRLSRVARLAVRGDFVQRPTFNVEHSTSNGEDSVAIEGGGRSKTAPLQDGQRSGGAARGLFVFFTDFRRAFVAREAWSGGQRRMADDELAPSRSYLKIEEAYGLLEREPVAGEVVVDLGAAPGGWSYSAAKRGARVIAVDNGPLKGGALEHPLIEHRAEDAFLFRPCFAKASQGAALGEDNGGAQQDCFPAGERGGDTPPTPEDFGTERDLRARFSESAPGRRAPPSGCVDWLFCDLVEEPHHVLRNLVGPWLEGGWCRRFVINLKLGRTDPLGLVRELRAAGSVFSRCATGVRVRHLYHDREELTVVGETRGRAS